MHTRTIEGFTPSHFISASLRGRFELEVPERITNSLCPHLWDTSTSQGRELMAASLRLLAWTADGERVRDRKEKERRARDEGPSSVRDGGKERWTESVREGVKGGRERLNGRKDNRHYGAPTVTPAGRFTPPAK